MKLTTTDLWQYDGFLRRMYNAGCNGKNDYECPKIHRRWLEAIEDEIMKTKKELNLLGEQERQQIHIEWEKEQ